MAKFLCILLTLALMLGMINVTTLAAATQTDGEIVHHSESTEYFEIFIENEDGVSEDTLFPREPGDFADSGDISIEIIDPDDSGRIPDRVPEGDLERYPEDDPDLSDMDIMSAFPAGDLLVTPSTTRTSTQLDVSAAGRIHTVTVRPVPGWWNHTGFWTMSTDPVSSSWVQFSDITGFPGTSRNIYVLRNDTRVSRTAVVIISAAGHQAHTIRITQDPIPGLRNVTPSTNPITVFPGGIAQTVTVTTSPEDGWWHMQTDRPDLIRFSYPWAQSGASRTIYMSRNETTLYRNATVTIVSAGTTYTMFFRQEPMRPGSLPLVPRRVDMRGIQFDVEGAIHWNNNNVNVLNVRSVVGVVTNRGATHLVPPINRFWFSVQDARETNRTEIEGVFPPVAPWGGTWREEVPWTDVTNNHIFPKNDFVVVGMRFGVSGFDVMLFGGYSVFFFPNSVRLYFYY